jgi:hypothetical protein
MRAVPWIAVAVLSIGGTSHAQQPGAPAQPARKVSELVGRAGRYVVEYGDRLSLLVGVERYTQLIRSTDTTTPVQRVLESEFALFRITDDWMGFRDVYKVDGAAVGDRRDRVMTLLSSRSEEGFAEGRRIADESARYNLGAVQRNFNTPTIALFFLHPKNQSRFRYDRTGEGTVDGTAVWTVRFRETGRPTIVRTTAGKDVPASGTFWIDPVSGRVLETRLDLRTELESAPDGQNPKPVGDPPSLAPAGRTSRIRTTASISVVYKWDARFGLLLPAEMRETYEGTPAGRGGTAEAATLITCVATYSDFRAFETSGKLIVR